MKKIFKDFKSIFICVKFLEHHRCPPLEHDPHRARVRHRQTSGGATNCARKKHSDRSQSDFKPGVDFINVLRAAFAPVDPKSVKNTVKSSVTFYAFGIYERKSCTRMLMKLSPGVNFINVLPAAFTPVDPKSVK